MELDTVLLHRAVSQFGPLGYSFTGYEHHLFMAVRFTPHAVQPGFEALAKQFAGIPRVMSCAPRWGSADDPRSYYYHSVLHFELAKAENDPTGLNLAMALLGIIGPRYRYNAVFERHSPDTVAIKLYMLGLAGTSDPTLPHLDFDLELLHMVRGVRTVSKTGEDTLRVTAESGYDASEVAIAVAKMAGIKPAPVRDLVR